MDAGHKSTGEGSRGRAGRGGELKWRFLKKSQTYSRSGIEEGQRGALESA